VIDDWHCLDLARGGNESAWRDLFERHYPSLVRMTSFITGSIDTGKDLAQESFVRLLHVQIRHQTGSFKSFLSTIAYRLALREKSRFNSLVPSDAAIIDDGSPSPLELAIRDDTDRIIFQVIQSLSVEHRVILTLRYFGGHTYEEIARITDLPIGTVKSRIFYAIKVCREMLKERGVFK
jgi:RNA polymerase sigma-70 factor (ECF subfamily)